MKRTTTGQRDSPSDEPKHGIVSQLLPKGHHLYVLLSFIYDFLTSHEEEFYFRKLLQVYMKEAENVIH